MIEQRYSALDGLRGIAALVVVLYHIRWPWHFKDALFIKNGYLAVDLFFILSGFVIGLVYSDWITSADTARAFVRRRFFRIYPLHLAVLAVLLSRECLKLAAAQGGFLTANLPPFSGANDLTLLVASLTLTHAWGLASTLAWNGPSWSISCEFAAYLVFAAAAWVGLLGRRIFVFGLAAAATPIYFWLAFHFSTLDKTFDWGLLRCLAGFSLGLALRFVPRVHPSIGTAAALAIPFALAFASGTSVILTIPLFATAIVGLCSNRGAAVRFLNTRPVQFLGLTSYSIYLIHEPILSTFNSIIKRVPALNVWTGDLLLLLSMGGIFALSALTYHHIEAPGRRLGRAKHQALKRATRPVAA